MGLTGNRCFFLFTARDEDHGAAIDHPAKAPRFCHRFITGKHSCPSSVRRTIGTVGIHDHDGVLVSFYTAGVFLSLKWNKWRSWLEPSPFPLIKNGKIIYKNLAKARISIDFLLSESRKEKIEDIQKVALALWEPDGTISFFLHPQHQALTPADMQLAAKPFSFPRTIIKEGKIDFHELKQIGKDEMWLKNTIKMTYNADISDILLATIDYNNTIKIFWYER